MIKPGHQNVITEMLKKITKLERDVCKYTPLAFPIGSVVEWEHGFHFRTATVIGHTQFGRRVWVESPSGKRYWVDLERLLQNDTDHDEQKSSAASVS